MSRIRLELRKTDEVRFTRPDGSWGPIPELRPFAKILIGRSTGAVDAMVDTGAPLSFFPEGTWESFAAPACDPPTVQVYPGFDKTPVPNLPRYTVAGRTYLCKQGLVPVTILDDDGARLPALVVAAYFYVARLEPKPKPFDPTDKDKDLKRPILGLWNGVLEGRYFVVSPHANEAHREAWITDERPVDPRH